MFDRLNIPKKNLILIKEDTILEKIGVKSNNARELNRGFFGQWDAWRRTASSSPSLYKWWMCQDPLRERERA